MKQRSLPVAGHEAAHIVVGSALGLKLKEAVIGAGYDERGDPLEGYCWFPKGPLEALAIMYAAGVAWEEKRGNAHARKSADAKLLRACVATQAGARACIRAAALMLESLGPAHAAVTRALVDRDLIGADIVALARGEKLENE